MNLHKLLPSLIDGEQNMNADEFEEELFNLCINRLGKS